MTLHKNPDEDFNTYPAPSQAQKPLLVQSDPDPRWVKSYGRFFRKMDRAVNMAFMGMQVIDDQHTPFNIPTIFGTAEKIVYAVFGDTARAMQDNSGQYSKVRVPIVGIMPLAPSFDEERYIYHEARVWEKRISERVPNDVAFGESVGLPIDRAYRIRVLTRYFEDHNQLVEQVLLRFSKSLELRIGGNFFESDLRLSGMSANYDEPAEDDKIKLYRTDFDVVAKGWLPQPVRREKTVLAVKVDFGVGDPTKLGGFQSDARFTIRPNVVPNEDLPPSQNY